MRIKAVEHELGELSQDLGQWADDEAKTQKCALVVEICDAHQAVCDALAELFAVSTGVTTDELGEALACPSMVAPDSIGHHVAPEIPLRAYTKAGGCRTGGDKTGHIYHALPAGSEGSLAKALCGTEPGRRGGGWGSWPKDVSAVNCPRCLRAMVRDVVGATHAGSTIGARQ